MHTLHSDHSRVSPSKTLNERFRNHLLRELKDDNTADLAYYIYYARIMKERGVLVRLNNLSMPIPPNPEGKTIGERIGEETYYSITVSIGDERRDTKTGPYISATILESFDIAVSMREHPHGVDTKNKKG